MSANSLEKSRKELADEYERVQKKAFTNWINSHLLKASAKVEDLYVDLRDGQRLLLLLEVLTQVKLPREKGKMRFHKLQNVTTALEFLTKDRRIKIVGIATEHIVDGNGKLTLGLVWTLILHFQISHGIGLAPEDRPTSPQAISTKDLKDKLLEWAQRATEGYDDVNLTNFDKSWRDGMGFCAIINRHHPELLDFDDCDLETPLENLERAFSVAESELDIIRIVDPEDVCVPKPDDKAVLTYVSYLYNAFPDMPPPHWRRKPVMSPDSYQTLYDTTKDWISQATHQCESREFPNTIEALKAMMAEFDKSVTLELPGRKRDMASLLELSDKLTAQKKTTIPTEYNYTTLEQAWTELQSDCSSCRQAMEDELKRLEDLDSLAGQILQEFSETESGISELEGRIEEFQTTVASMPQGDAARETEQLKIEINALEDALGKQEPSLQQLKDGHYHNNREVEERVIGLRSLLESLSFKLEEATSAMGEATMVAALESKLEGLELWLVTSGKFSNNQHILVQIEDHKAFETEQIKAAQEKVAHINSTSPPPGLDEKVKEVNLRFNLVVKQTNDRLSGLEPIVSTVREFDSVSKPLEEWCSVTRESYDQLQPLEVTVEQLERQKEEVAGIREGIAAREDQVEQAQTLSEKFFRDSEPVQSLADRYARKLRRTQKVTEAISSRDNSEDLEEASILEQAEAIQSEWSWLNSSSRARARQIDELIDKISQFDEQYNTLREFVEGGTSLLENEKPVGDTSVRIDEQMETCQEFRAKISAKQSAVEAMLAIGREVIAEHNTTSQTDALMNKLTSFIADWSDLQLTWQNWYDELHAHMEQSQDLSNQLDKLQSDISSLEPLCSSLLPANLTMDGLKQQLHNLQIKFSIEVVSPYEETKVLYDDLQTKTQLLPDQQAAEESFSRFQEIAKNIESCRGELDGVVGDVDSWWDDLEGESEWLTSVQAILTKHRPMASSLDLIQEQEDEIKGVSQDVEAHKSKVEKVLKCLGDLGASERVIDTAPVLTHRDNLNTQWEALCNEVQERADLCTSGKTQLGSYSGECVPLAEWLGSAEEVVRDLATLPRNREELVRRQEEVREFHSDVTSHGEALDQAENLSSSLLSSAKGYQSLLVSYRQSVDVLSGGEWFVKPGEDLTRLPYTPTFHEEHYDNLIRIVTPNSGSLRARYEALCGSVVELRGLVEEGLKRRAEFDQSLEEFSAALDDIEHKCPQAQALGVQDRVEAVRSLEVDCLALEPRLQGLSSQYELLCDLDESGGLWVGEDQALTARDQAQRRHKELLDRLRAQREAITAELSDAKAFLGSRDDFLSWLRETERNIQRDDHLKLEEADLNNGLATLKGVAAKIADHKPAYDALCVKCGELLERGAHESDDLKQNLENIQERWNAIQIVHDDIEVIEETLPKLESFNASYSKLLGSSDDLLSTITSFSVSAISNEGLESKNQGLQELATEVTTRKADYEALLNSCDLFDTPFDTTKFQANINNLKDKLTHCDKALSSKRADHKMLGKKVKPMEELFNKFRQWLGETSDQLDSLSPPSSDEQARARQLQQAKVLVENVEAHREGLESVESSVNILSPLLDPSEQAQLRAHLEELTALYDTLKFNCELYTVERWLEDQSLKLASMTLTGVTVPTLQDQQSEMQEFQKSLNSFSAQLSSLQATGTQCDSSNSDQPASVKMTQVQLHYDKLGGLAEERVGLLNGYLPNVQRYESSRVAWETLLCGWEKRASVLPSPGATPESIQAQIEDIKALQQAITDHEPEFESLQRELGTLCQGPDDESAFIERTLADLGGNTDSLRPGQETQESTIADYQVRLDALKRTLESDSTELSSKLEQSSRFREDIARLGAWAEDTLAGLQDKLVLRDPKSQVILDQQSQCKAMLEELSANQVTKDSLLPSFTQLTANLPANSEEKQELQSSLDNLNTKWSDLSEKLKQHQSSIDSALPLAKSHEGALTSLQPWVPDTLGRLESLGPPPADPHMVERLKTEVESLKAEYNNLAPVYSSCIEDGQSLSAKCEDGQPRSLHDSAVTQLTDQWDKLSSLFSDLLRMLTDALVQTQEFQGIADGLDRWMDTMSTTLRKQARIAARVRLIEPQVEGFRHILSDIAAYSATVDQASTMGSSLVDDSKPEESLKVTGRLEALTTQFHQLESAAQTRMGRLEGALRSAASYEDQGSEFNNWLVEAETKLNSMEALPITSEPLNRQLEDIKASVQDIEAHSVDLNNVTTAERDLFDTELPTIQLCEECLTKPPEEIKVVLPVWFERPGTTDGRPGSLEAIEVGLDLRNRFNQLKVSTGERTDQAKQLLESVLSYESAFDKFNEWLTEEVVAVSSLPPPAVTVEQIKEQIEQLENVQRDFTNQEPALESLDLQGTSLIASCSAELSQSSARIRLSDLNQTWGDSLSALNQRGERLNKGLSLAGTYEGLYDGFDEWLTDCEAKVDEPLKVDGDPKAFKKQLEQLKALEEAVLAHKKDLKSVVDAGHKLEGYTDFERSSLPDIGYIALEDRYLALKVKVGERLSKLDDALNLVSDVSGQLEDLLKQLEKLRTQLDNQKPARVQPHHLERQIKDLSDCESVFLELKPKLEAAKQDGATYASLESSATPPPEGVPSGADIQQLLTDLARSSDKVDQLLNNRSEQLNTNLETGRKFEQDHKALLDWLAVKSSAVSNGDPVRGVPEGAEEQLQQVEASQTELNERQSDLDNIKALGKSLTSKCSPEDSTFIKDKMAVLDSAVNNAERSVDLRRRMVDDGLGSALKFVQAWEDAMAAIAEKRAELEEMGDVGGDIDAVKAQLEEYKEFEASLSVLKSKVKKALELGGKLKDGCSSIDRPHLSEQLDQLNSAWSQLNTDSLSRKHNLEEGLLQLGQFQDALGELMAWIESSTDKLASAPPPAVRVADVENQTRDIEAVEAGISSHAPSVASLNAAAEKLLSSTTAGNTAEIQQERDDLNDKWERLKSLASDRTASLSQALPLVKSFDDSWKQELSWLTGAEARAYADWRPCGLPETCQADLTKHKAFTTEVEGHSETLTQLQASGATLKAHCSPNDKRVLDRWIDDLVKRYDDLKFSMDEREAQMNYAKDRADEFDQSYTELRDKVAAQEELAEKQGNIRSEVEAVKQQMEEHKDFMKVLGELEARADDLDGWGQLLTKDCVKPDGELIETRIEDIKARLEALISDASDRQTSLEESLLSLGEFEEAYDELWDWLSEALKTLENTEPITGDPDVVATQLSKHKALQKQLGSRLASKNAVSKAGKLLMKAKSGEDKAVLKRKLADLEREWEKACQVSVGRQDKLENAYKEIAEFRSYMTPLCSWTAKVLPSLDESEPVHGDLNTVDSLLASHGSLQRDIGAYQESVDEANAIGDHLVAEVLDDPTVTQQDLKELNEGWDSVCQRSVAKQERLEEAFIAAEQFETEHAQLVDWIEEHCDELQAMPPPEDDSTALQQQIDNHKELSQLVTSRQPDVDKVMGDGQNLLQVAHPKAVPVLQSKLQQLEQKWVDLRGKIGARSESLASALLELHGLQDMLDGLWGWVSQAEATIKDTEQTPIGNDMETVEKQLAEHEAFQEEMATQQPNMDALNKAAKKRKAAHPTANPEMTKKISSLYKRWQKLWLRSSERHRQLLEAKTRLKDIAQARSFDFDKWRKRFNTWVDQQKLRVSDLFNRFDGNHDGMLTREEFMKALKASGLAMTQIELEKIADSFDTDRSGMINLSSILGVIKGSTRRQPRSLNQGAQLTDSQKIDNEIQNQISKCTCSKQFMVTRVSEGKYRFGESQKLCLVRILRSTVMVRVGGGWEPLEAFLQKHDPCRALGRTNDNLRSLLTANPGLATAGFKTKASARVPSHKVGPTTRTSRRPPIDEHQESRHKQPSGRSTPVSSGSPGSTRKASKLQRPTTPSSTRTTSVRPTTPSSTRTTSVRPNTPSSSRGPMAKPPTNPSTSRTIARPTTPSSSRGIARPTTPSSSRGIARPTTPSTMKTSGLRAPTPLANKTSAAKTSPRHVASAESSTSNPPSTGESTASAPAKQTSRIPKPKSKIPTRTT